MSSFELSGETNFSVFSEFICIFNSSEFFRFKVSSFFSFQHRWADNTSNSKLGSILKLIQTFIYWFQIHNSFTIFKCFQGEKKLHCLYKNQNVLQMYILDVQYITIQTSKRIRRYLGLIFACCISLKGRLIATFLHTVCMLDDPKNRRFLNLASDFLPVPQSHRTTK